MYGPSREVSPARPYLRYENFLRATDSLCAAQHALAPRGLHWWNPPSLIVGLEYPHASEALVPAEHRPRVVPAESRLIPVPSEERPRLRCIPHARFHIAEIVAR